MSSGHSTDSPLVARIKAEALRLGFYSCGIAKAGVVDSRTAAGLLTWLENGGHAGMAYMGNHTDKRLDPQQLMPGVKSIVCVALSYAPVRHMPQGEYQLASYAYGHDYHDVMKAKLKALAQHIEQSLQAADAPNGQTAQPSAVTTRVFCDTAPVLERHWATRAGLGWIGRNHQLIIPHAGSMFFLGEVFVNKELPYDSPVSNRCGSCHACTDACPTRALHAEADGSATFCSELCLSYLTIENRGDIPPQAARVMGDTIYGCDRCQQACPWNRFAVPSTEPQLQPADGLMSMRKADWHSLTVEDYRRLFKGSAVKRAKYEGLTRNIRAARQGNSGNDEPIG